MISKLNEEKKENHDFTRPSADVDVIAVDSGEGDAVVASHPDERSHSKVHEGMSIYDSVYTESFIEEKCFIDIN